MTALTSWKRSREVTRAHRSHTRTPSRLSRSVPIAASSFGQEKYGIGCSVLDPSFGFVLFMTLAVEAILVNIFGGIVNCAIIAKGITKACRELELKVPLVVRLEGTNVEEAKRILSESGLPITAANNLDDAAKKAVASIAKK
ncbi:hypothetical protein JZ751_017871 [Albula glossodonta]|uniref:ATP-citrate synthase/succinyl-CoA ligase C-terminal domain-containing protein n=1 Tax=Albula glossodonta TaxID=121402 RepID=A0A8T2PPL1_9TELE|nr:hypothetical protein JZ751_017871 [Albula glossodonta]